MVQINELVKSINEGLANNTRRIFDISKNIALRYSIYLKGTFTANNNGGGDIEYPSYYIVYGNFTKHVYGHTKSDGTRVKPYTKKVNTKHEHTDPAVLREAARAGLKKLKYDIGDKLKKYGRVEIT